jgi:5-amino-6-(5-phosphoribosylamino)uracil reductase
MKPDYTSLEFPPAPQSRPYVIVNMVMSADGRTILGGSEQGIGTKVDQRLMRELRVHADITFNGATTLRVSGVSPRTGDPLLEQLRVSRGKPPVATAAIITRSGDLPYERPFFTATDFDAVVYLAADAPAGAIDRIVSAGRPVVALPTEQPIPWMLAHMRHEMGAELLLCEGGATINGQLAAEGFIDEFFVTLGPVIVGGKGLPGTVEGPPFTNENAPRLKLVSSNPNEATGELYLRYRVIRGEETSLG